MRVKCNLFIQIDLAKQVRSPDLLISFVTRGIIREQRIQATLTRRKL